MFLNFSDILLSFVLSVGVTTVFYFNKTIYTLLTSLFAFLFVSGYLLYISFEFLALAFVMTYIGGIAVMFLFLVLVVDVKDENVKTLFFSNYNYFEVVGLTSVSSLFFTFLFITIYNPFIFNDTIFQDLFSTIMEFT
jgi:NADH-quinone oxidoreductase subunit J